MDAELLSTRGGPSKSRHEPSRAATEEDLAVAMIDGLGQSLRCGRFILALRREGQLRQS